MTETTDFVTTNTNQNKEDFKLFFLQLLKEDSSFCSKIVDKDVIKLILEDVLKEHKPEWQNFWEELITKFIAKQSDKSPLDMTEIRQKYALKRDAFIPLHHLFEETLPAYELTKRLSK